MAKGNVYTNFHDISKLLEDVKREMANPTPITWVRSEDELRLTGMHEVRWSSGLSEKDIDPIQEWCHASNCGKRTAFASFKFENEEQITMFLMRWSQ